MPHDVTTCWNSTFDMLEFALLYHEPLDALTSLWEMKLRAYELSKGEWKIAEQFLVFWKWVTHYCLAVLHWWHSMQIFKQATLFFSADTPNPSKVIPTMDWIDKHLASSALDAKYLPSIKASMLIGKQLLNKYYNFTDHSEVYHIAMGMFHHVKPSEVHSGLLTWSYSPWPQVQAQLFSDLKDGKKTASTQHATSLRLNSIEPIAISTMTWMRSVVHWHWYVTLMHCFWCL